MSPHFVYHSNGTTSQTDWSCCNKISDTDINGVETFYVYDELKRIINSTKAGVTSPEVPMADVVTSYSYDGASRVIAETITADNLQQMTAKAYDIAGRITEQTDAAGHVSTTAYNPESLTTTVTLPGEATEITRSYLDGQIKSIAGTAVVPSYYEYGVNSDGTRWTKVSIGSADSPAWNLTVTDMAGRTVRTEKPGYGGTLVTANVYDERQRLVRTSVPGLADTLFVYDSLGNQVMSGLDIDGNGQLETASIDRIQGSETSFTKIEANWWKERVQQVYPTDNVGTPVTVAVQRNQLTGLLEDGEADESITIDIHGNQTVSRTLIDRDAKTVSHIVDHPDSTIDARTVSINGLVMENRSKTNHTITFSYDPLGRRTAVIDPRTGEAITSYNDKGQVEYVKDAAGHRTSFDYDPLTGRTIQQTNPDNTTSYFEYNNRGQLIRSWGSAGYPTRHVFDSYGRKVELHTYRAESGWDAPSWPSTPGESAVTTWQYHEATGLLQMKTDAENNSTTYTYTQPGQLLTRTWARDNASIVTTYGYDANTSELVGIDHSDGTPDVTFSYDRLGRQKNITDGLGSRAFTYLATLEPDTETLSGLYSASLTKTYSGLAGRNDGVTIDNGYEVNYGFDATGRFASLNWQHGSNSGSAVYGYLPDSNLLHTITNSSGTGTGVTTYSYEAKRNVKTGVNNSYNSNTISDYQYQYDSMGRRKNVRNTGSAFAAAAFNLYEYNDRSEVTGSTRYQGTDLTDLTSPQADERRTYAYDAIGNRDTATLGEGSSQTDIDYTTNALNQYAAITGGDITGLVYDEDGNLTGYSKAGKSLSLIFNAENRLVEISPATPAPGDIRSVYLYDYQGRRVRKQLSSWDGSNWQSAGDSFFVYDGWNMVAELDQTGAVTSAYVWGLDLSQSLQGAGGVGGLLARIDITNDISQHYFYDGNGNVGQLINIADGTIAARYEYDPFGNTILADGALADINPYRFSTKYSDDESGLYYYGYRYYLAELGRWVSKDPIEEDGGLNLYGFVTNSSTNLVDKRGLDVFVVYRELHIVGLEYSYPLTGHVYLAFNNDNMGRSNEWQEILQQNRGLMQRDWITFSFHPDGVRTGTNQGNRASVLYTETSWVDISNLRADIRPIIDSQTINFLITQEPCQQVAIFREALASAQINRRSPGQNDIGHYSFGIRNCGSWAKAIVENAGSQWPTSAYFLNGGTGVDGPLDYTMIPQAAYGLSVAGYHALTGAGDAFVEFDRALRDSINEFNANHDNMTIGPVNVNGDQYPGVTIDF